MGSALKRTNMPSEPLDGIPKTKQSRENMNEQDLDLDNLDNLLEDFDGVTVEGGVDSENDDGCEGGACKI
ncbi:hypothetical protein NMBH4476_0838 [Neisseria meningitidis H44/76]|jgi:hypothetical protein|nr:hypothetical protein NMBH4476_0838 [Neisseria meningitidis H44/76]EGC62923.1 hypothetical protein NMBCU385_0790 [Neisseria meningitidis CU385]